MKLRITPVKREIYMKSFLQSSNEEICELTEKFCNNW